MELQALTPELPQLLREIGVNYDPDRLAEVLATRQLQVSGRAIRVVAVLGGFVGSLLQASPQLLQEALQEALVSLEPQRKNTPRSDETLAVTTAHSGLIIHMWRAQKAPTHVSLRGARSSSGASTFRE